MDLKYFLDSYEKHIKNENAKGVLVAHYLNKMGGNEIHFKIFEQPNGNHTYTITNQRGINISASAIDLVSSHAEAKRNIDRTIMYFEKDGDRGAMKHLSSFIAPWKRQPLKEETDLAESRPNTLPIRYNTFVMGCDRVGKRLVQLGSDIKKLSGNEAVDSKQDIINEMKAIEKEVMKLAKDVNNI